MPTFEGANIQKAIEEGLTTLQVTRDKVTVQVISEGRRGFLGFGHKNAIVSLDLVPKPVNKKHSERTKIQAKKESKKATSNVYGSASVSIRQQPKTVIEEQAVAAEVTVKPEPEMVVQTEKSADNTEVFKDLGVYITNICATLKTPILVKLNWQHNQVMYQLDTDKEGLVIGKHGRTINAMQYLAQTYFNHYGHGKYTIVLNVGNYRQRREETLQHLAEKAAREVIATGQPYFLDPMPSFERKIIHQQLSENEYVRTYSEGKDPHRYVVIAPDAKSKL